MHIYTFNVYIIKSAACIYHIVTQRNFELYIALLQKPQDTVLPQSPCPPLKLPKCRESSRRSIRLPQTRPWPTPRVYQQKQPNRVDVFTTSAWEIPAASRPKFCEVHIPLKDHEKKTPFLLMKNNHHLFRP